MIKINKKTNFIHVFLTVSVYMPQVLGCPRRPEEGDVPANGIPGICDYLAFAIHHIFSATALLLVENLLSKSKLTDKLW